MLVHQQSPFFLHDTLLLRFRSSLVLEHAFASLVKVCAVRGGGKTLIQTTRKCAAKEQRNKPKTAKKHTFQSDTPAGQRIYEYMKQKGQTLLLRSISFLSRTRKGGAMSPNERTMIHGNSFPFLGCTEHV